MPAALISKITLKAIGAQPKPHTIKTRTRVAEIYGSARKYSIGSSTFGSFVKFHGDFEGVNCADGETFRSPALLLPELAQELLVSALNHAGATAGKLKSEENKGTEGESASSAVDFAFAVICVPVADGKPSTTGYTYQIEPIVEPTGADPLAALRSTVHGQKSIGQDTAALVTRHTHAPVASESQGKAVHGGKKK